MASKKDFGAALEQHPMARLLTSSQPESERQEEPPQKKTKPEPIDPKAVVEEKPTSSPPPTQEKMVKVSYLIAQRQHKALKLRAALSDDPEEKDMSTMVRKAIDLLLATDKDIK